MFFKVFINVLELILILRMIVLVFDVNFLFIIEDVIKGIEFIVVVIFFSVYIILFVGVILLFWLIIV